MRIFVLALFAFAALTTSAEAETCSHRVARCPSKGAWGAYLWQGKARCYEDFQRCLATGEWWADRAGHNITKGLTKE
jgi:hypothetical protein